MKCQTCFQNEAVYGGECNDCLKSTEYKFEGMYDKLGVFLSILIAAEFVLLLILILYAIIW